MTFRSKDEGRWHGRSRTLSSQDGWRKPPSQFLTSEADVRGHLRQLEPEERMASSLLPPELLAKQHLQLCPQPVQEDAVMSHMHHHSRSPFVGGAPNRSGDRGATPATVVEVCPTPSVSLQGTRVPWNLAVRDWSSPDPALPPQVGGRLSLCSNQW